MSLFVVDIVLVDILCYVSTTSDDAELLALNYKNLADHLSKKTRVRHTGVPPSRSIFLSVWLLRADILLIMI